MVLLLFSLFVLAPEEPALLSQESGTKPSQENSQDDWVRLLDRHDTPEAMELAVIFRQMLRTGVSDRLSALQRLENLDTRNQLQLYRNETVMILERAALDGSLRIVRRNGITVNDFPEIRIRAVRLLGSVGGPDAERLVKQVLIIENNPDVLAAAVSSLAALGITPEQDTLDLLTGINLRNNSTYHSPGLAFAILDTIVTIHRRDPVTDPSLFLSIVEITRSSFPVSVRTRARDVVDILRGI